MTTLTVGLPLASLVGDEKAVTTKAVQGFMTGRHTWQADDRPHTLDISQVVPASQPVGALYDYLLNAEIKMTPDKLKAFTDGIGVLNVGMNTLDVLAAEDRAANETLTGAAQLGVRRLLDLSNERRLYTVAEMDQRLRAGKVDTTHTLPVWAHEVKGFIDQVWGAAWQRFTVVVIVGGGSILLRDVLARKFGPRAVFPDDPVLSTANGLYKFARLKKYPDPIAIDLGYGNIKLRGAAGSVIMPAAVSVNGQRSLGETVGLKSAARPLHIRADFGQFYTGGNAHRFGRPVQSLDLDRVAGSPEMRALFYGALSKYQAIDLAG